METRQSLTLPTSYGPVYVQKVTETMVLDGRQVTKESVEVFNNPACRQGDLIGWYGSVAGFLQYYAGDTKIHF